MFFKRVKEILNENMVQLKKCFLIVVDCSFACAEEVLKYFLYGSMYSIFL